MISALSGQIWPLILAGYNLLGVSLRIVALLTLPGRLAPATAVAWLLVILLWPVPGFIIYGIFGSRLLPANRLARHKEHHDRLTVYREKEPATELRDNSDLSPSALPTAQLATRLCDAPVTGDNCMTILQGSEPFFDALLNLISHAKKDLKLLYYIFDERGPCARVIDEVIKAANRGVHVEIMVDSVGSAGFIKRKGIQTLRHHGIEIIELLPVKLFRRHAARYDLRNHRKLALADHCHAITGSHNLIDPSYGGKALLWQDLSVELQGPICRHLEWLYQDDRFAETGREETLVELLQRPLPAGTAPIQALPSGPSYRSENFLLVVLSALTAAKREVTITSPYLVPSQGLLQGLAVALGRGVTIRLIVPERSDQLLASLAARAYYDELLDLGVELYLHRQGLLHAKTITVDDELAFVGSNNFDIRSFALNFELSLGFYRAEEARALRQAQELYLSESIRLTPDEWGRRGTFARSVQGLTKLISPLL